MTSSKCLLLILLVAVVVVVGGGGGGGGNLMITLLNVMYCNVLLCNVVFRFDLKGSLAGRRTSPESCKQGAVQKDLNLMESGMEHIAERNH